MAAMLDAFASSLARILAETAKEEVEALLGVPGEISRLEATLGDLRAVLSDAERARCKMNGRSDTLCLGFAPIYIGRKSLYRGCYKRLNHRSLSREFTTNQPYLSILTNYR